MAQSSITKFFLPKPALGSGSPRKGTQQPLDENTSPNKEMETVTPTKRLKLDNEECSPQVGGLTPGKSSWYTSWPLFWCKEACFGFTDQKKRASENQLRAKIKLTSRQLEGALHPNIGTTWFAALESEFKKVEGLKNKRFLLSYWTFKMLPGLLLQAVVFFGLWKSS